ncbi:MAG: hypothetical protein ACI4IW_02420 [Oscillospiraceae bacterium]
MTRLIDVLSEGLFSFAFCAMLAMLFSLFLAVEVWMNCPKKRYIVFASVFAAASVAMFYGFNCVSAYRGGWLQIEREFYNVPAVAAALLIAAIAGGDAALAVKLRRQKKNMLTPGAIKESIDALPDGVCFFADDGQPLLINTQMNRISGELFGTEILNANRFVEGIRNHSVKDSSKIIRTEPSFEVMTGDEKVWELHLRELKMGKSRANELTAFDVTEQYRLSRELEQRNDRLNAVNERLRLFSKEMVHFTAEKELLEAKIKVHDGVGRSLLAFRSYLEKEPEHRDKKSLLFLWRYVISIMNKEIDPDGDWGLLEDAAESLNISIELSGNMPDNYRIKSAVTAAIRECLTNTARHAGGDKLFVSITESSEEIKVEFTNTGKQPYGEIEEKGGLRNLRNTVERAGGTMTVESLPRFLLRLEFVKGGTGEWQKQESLS